MRFMNKKEMVETLCSKGHRGSTSAEERWAAEWVKGFWEEHGLETVLLPFRGATTYAQRLVVHLLPVAVAALLVFLGGWFPLLSLLLLVLLLASFTVECVFLAPVLSRLTPQGDSVNVLGKLERPGATKRILICAHYDSQREGELFNPKNIERMKGFVTPNSRITPIHLTYLSAAFLAVTSALFMMELASPFTLVLQLLHLLSTAWILVSLAINLQWMTSKRFVPGANDNATGVAVMLDIARKYALKWQEGENSNADLWFLATGCEETGMDGSLAFIRQKKAELKEKETLVVNLDGFGQGAVHYLTADGCLITRPYDPGLVKLAGELEKERFPDIRPLVSRVFTDGLAFSVAGFPAITFLALDSINLAAHHYHWRTDIPENVNFQAVDRAQLFVEAFLEKLLFPGEHFDAA